MSNQKEKLAALIARQPDVIDKLDQLLSCPNDRAFIVCSYQDCIHNHKGACTIFTVLDTVSRADGKPCNKYERLT